MRRHEPPTVVYRYKYPDEHKEWTYVPGFVFFTLEELCRWRVAEGLDIPFPNPILEVIVVDKVLFRIKH